MVGVKIKKYLWKICKKQKKRYRKEEGKSAKQVKDKYMYHMSEEEKRSVIKCKIHNNKG